MRSTAAPHSPGRRERSSRRRRRGARAGRRSPPCCAMETFRWRAHAGWRGWYCATTPYRSTAWRLVRPLTFHRFAVILVFERNAAAWCRRLRTSDRFGGPWASPEVLFLFLAIRSVLFVGVINRWHAS